MMSAFFLRTRHRRILREMEVGKPQRISAERDLYTVISTPFEVPNYYQVVQPVGYGAYGFVVSALDRRDGSKVAIKKNSRVFRDLLDCKRIVREIFVLLHLSHENVLHVRDVYLPTDSESPNDQTKLPAASSSCRDVYIVSDLMDTSLYNVIRSPGTQTLDHTHYKFFAYQMLRGLKYIHSANIIHRDLKPANVLVNVNCDLQICDFGLARQFTRDAAMTDYVVTRYYRPPEVLLMCSTYTTVVDTWSIGCIVVEMMTKHTLFKGQDYLQQLDMILNALRPSREDLAFLDSEQSVDHVVERVKVLEKGWGPKPALAPSITDPLARDFIAKMLTFNPSRRWTAAQLLEHPYIAELHDPSDEPVAAAPFVWEYEGLDMSENLLRSELYRATAIFAARRNAASISSQLGAGKRQ